MGAVGPISDARWMAGAIALSARGRALSAPNPNVGCLIVKEERVIGRGWTQAGGRPHAEAMALAQAGVTMFSKIEGATAYVSLEPCFHYSGRGPDCASLLLTSGIARVVIALQDPDPRTAGKGIALLRSKGVQVDMLPSAAPAARAAMVGWLSRMERGRPFVTLKLATSLDGCIALASGESQWITGPEARTHAHLERALSNAILVGRGTVQADNPRLDVRLPGLTSRSPQRIVLTSGPAPDGWTAIRTPEEIAQLDAHYLLVEGGAGAAASFLKAGLVDRTLLYRAPIFMGGGLPCLGDIGLERLADAHGRWQRTDTRQLGKDGLEVYEAVHGGV